MVIANKDGGDDDDNNNDDNKDNDTKIFTMNLINCHCRIRSYTYDSSEI